MAAWLVALHSCRATGHHLVAAAAFLGPGKTNWWHNRWFWKSSAGLASSCEALANDHAWKGGSLAGECLDGERGRQELWWLKHRVGGWLNNVYRPGWGPAGYERCVTAEAVMQLCEQGELTELVEGLAVLVQTDSRVSQSLFYAVLKGCMVQKNLVLGRRVHALTVKEGCQSDTFLCNHIMRMYASHARLQEAMDVFAAAAEPDAFMWSSIISAHVKHGQDKRAIQLYNRMHRSSVKPDGHVFVAALQACARGGDLKTGQQVHADVLATGVEPDSFVYNSLVDMYAKCGSLEGARRVFDGLGGKDAVTWTALIAGYSQQSMGQEALHLYSAMQEEGAAVPDAVTFVCLLQACASVGAPALEKGRQLHRQIRERGLQADAVVGGSLVNMYAKCGNLEDAKTVFDGLDHKNVVAWTALIAGYAKCGSLEDAQGVFDGLGEKNVVTWTALMSGYSQQGMGQEALRLYSRMQEEGVIAPNTLTFVCLLQACANTAALHVGRQLHAQVKDQGLQADVLVAISLISMYGKCGSMVDAQQVFEALAEKDVITWNALIAGYSRQGDSAVVLDLFHRMEEDGIHPASITFLSVLTVCSHAGLVNKGQEYFEAMSRQYNLTPTMEHYTCMVDLLGRAGQLDEALGLVRTMPVQPNAVVWRTLLGACQKWSNVEVGRHAFDEAVKLDKKDAAAYVLMLNIYTSTQMWEQAQEMQARRLGVGAWKEPGQSWWTDLDGLVHSFLVGDKKHPESGSIYARLKQLFIKMQNQGLLPHLV